MHEHPTESHAQHNEGHEWKASFALSMTLSFSGRSLRDAS